VTVRALAYAVSLGQPVLALHVSPTEEEAKRFREYWADWGNHVPLEVVKSPYRAVIPPTVAYIEALHAQRPELTLTVIVPELALRRWWQRLLYETPRRDSAVRWQNFRRSSSQASRSMPEERSRKLRDDGSPAWT
jgi:hypothetical protein